MPEYELSAWINLSADNPVDALTRAQQLADEATMSGDFSLSIDDGEPIDVTDE